MRKEWVWVVMVAVLLVGMASLLHHAHALNEDKNVLSKGNSTLRLEQKALLWEYKNQGNRIEELKGRTLLPLRPSSKEGDAKEQAEVSPNLSDYSNLEGGVAELYDRAIITMVVNSYAVDQNGSEKFDNHPDYSIVRDVWSTIEKFEASGYTKEANELRLRLNWYVDHFPAKYLVPEVLRPDLPSPG